MGVFGYYVLTLHIGIGVLINKNVKGALIRIDVPIGRGELNGINIV